MVNLVIIDMHVHLREKVNDTEWMWKQWSNTEPRELTGEQFIEKMENSYPKIDKAVVFGSRSLCSETPETMRRDNNYILKIVSEYPDRYIGAGVIDPSWGDKAIKELHRCVNAGIKIVKIRFSSMRFRPFSKASIRVIKEVEKLGILPLIHSDESHFSHPFLLGELARSFPNVKFVMQHFGILLSVDAFHIAKNIPNLYADTSASRIRLRNLVKFVKEVSPDRLMYGSDTGSVRGGLQPQDELDRVLSLSLQKENENKILGGNAETLLRSVGVKL